MEIIYTTLRAIPYLVILIIAALILSYIWLLWDNRHTFKIAKQLPGPAGLPIIGNIHQIAGAGFETLNKMMALLNVYPGIVRLWFGPKLVIVTDQPDILKILLNHPEALNKPYIYFALEMFLKNGLVTSEPQKWRRHRKVLSPSFNHKDLDTFVEIFSRKSAILAEQLKKFSGKKYADFFHVAYKCTSDIICETALGLNLDIQEVNIRFVDEIETTLSMMNYRTFSVWYHLDFIWNLSPSSKILEKSLNYLCGLVDIVLNDKLDSYNSSQNDKSLNSEDEPAEIPKKPKAILDLLIEDSSFTKEEIIEEIYTFLGAGTETTAATFCFTCLMLAMFPDIQQKVRDEISSVMGDVDDIIPDRLKDMEYTERVIKETMRLFPVAPLIGRHTTADIPIDLTIPGNSMVLVSVANIHRNPKYWPDPLKFDPDRFLPEEVAKRHPCVHLPFSYGIRNCIGARYAMMNLKTMLSFVIPRFTLHTDYKSVDEVKITMSVFLKIKYGLKLWLESRYTEVISPL